MARAGMATCLGIPASPSPLDTRALVDEDEVNVIGDDDAIELAMARSERGGGVQSGGYTADNLLLARYLRGGSF